MIFDVKIEFPVSKYLYWEAEWAENYKKAKKFKKKFSSLTLKNFRKKCLKKDESEEQSEFLKKIKFLCIFKLCQSHWYYL